MPYAKKLATQAQSILPVVQLPSSDEDESDDEEDIDNGIPESDLIENRCLWLPSSLPASIPSTTLLEKLRAAELRLRIAQVGDAIEDLCRHLRTKQSLRHYKIIHVTGQRANTRAWTLLSRFDDKMKGDANRYRAARNAIISLSPQHPSLTRYQPLNSEDIRGPGRSDGESEGRHTPSWIWMCCRDPVPVGVDAEDPESDATAHEGMRVEWSRCLARHARWDEQYMGLQEEMRRVIVTLEYRRQSWLSRVRASRLIFSPSYLSGSDAYAYKQAAVNDRLAYRFARMWLPVLIDNGIHPEWEARYQERVGYPRYPKTRLKVVVDDIISEVENARKDSEMEEDEGGDEDFELFCGRRMTARDEEEAAGIRGGEGDVSDDSEDSDDEDEFV